MKRNALLMLGTLTIGACSLAPTYARPQLPIPSRLPANGDARGEAAATVAPDVGWRDLVTDPRLQTVIEAALTNNRDLRIAALNIDKARALYRIQRSELLPGVVASADGEKARVPADLSGTGSAVTSEQYSVSLGFASWELDFFGRVRSLKGRMLDQYLATEQARAATEISLVAAVADGYLALVADREGLQLARETLTAQQARYDLIRRSLELGVASELELRQSQSQIEAARVQIAVFEGLVAQDENALQLLVGAPVASNLVPDTLGAIDELKGLDPGLSSEVLLRRPDVRAAEFQLMAANANIGAARAAFFPRISLTAATGTASRDLDGLFSSGSGVWTFAPRVYLPIFSGGALRADLEAARIDRDIAVATYEKAIQSSFRNVSDALALRATLVRQQLAQEALVESLEATLSLSEARYRGGISSYLEVLVAQQALFAAQRNLVDVRLATRMNQVALFKVLGGGPSAAGQLGPATLPGGETTSAVEPGERRRTVNSGS